MQIESLSSCIHVLQLPIERSNCDYNDLNFTLVFEREEGDLVTEVPVTPHIYSGVIEERVTFEFGRNQMYSLRVTMEAYSQKFTTTKYSFSKLLPVCLKEILNSPKTSNISIVLAETFIISLYCMNWTLY